jgi:hypothetical protein
MLAEMGINEQTLYPGVEMEEAITFLNNALNAAKKGGIVLFI